MKTPTIEELISQGAKEIEVYKNKFNWRKFKFESVRVDTDKRIFKTIKDESFIFCDDESIFYKDFTGKIHWLE